MTSRRPFSSKRSSASGLDVVGDLPCVHVVDERLQCGHRVAAPPADRHHRCPTRLPARQRTVSRWSRPTIRYGCWPTLRPGRRSGFVSQPVAELGGPFQRGRSTANAVGPPTAASNPTTAAAAAILRWPRPSTATAATIATAASVQGSHRWPQSRCGAAVSADQAAVTRDHRRQHDAAVRSRPRLRQAHTVSDTAPRWPPPVRQARSARACRRWQSCRSPCRALLSGGLGHRCEPPVSAEYVGVTLSSHVESRRLPHLRRPARPALLRSVVAGGGRESAPGGRSGLRARQSHRHARRALARRGDRGVGQLAGNGRIRQGAWGRRAGRRCPVLGTEARHRRGGQQRHPAVGARARRTAGSLGGCAVAGFVDRGADAGQLQRAVARGGACGGAARTVRKQAARHAVSGRQGGQPRQPSTRACSPTRVAGWTPGRPRMSTS